ncbi:MAG: ferredoxin--NADP reductase [Armatimonadota bacterium]
MAQPTTTTTVKAVREVAPGVREIVLAAPAEPLSFRAGQWLSLHLPVGEHPPLVRAYSLAAPPSPDGELTLCLDRVPDGLGSGYLFSVSPGDEIRFAGVLGNFVLPEAPGELLWLARYTGIVPFRAMLLELRQSPPPRKVTLIYSAARPEDLAYHAELLRTAEECEWFELIAAVDEPDAGWAGRVGPVLELLPAWLGDRADLTPMICGKREFVRPLRDFFYERGFGRRDVKWENYD